MRRSLGAHKFLLLAWMLSLAYFLPVALQGRTFIGDDAAAFELPSLTFLRHTWGRGHFELWNPYSSGGLPTIVYTLGRLFYPPQLFFEVFDPVSSMLGYFFLNHLVAITGAYFYLRSHRLSRMGSMIGCLTYGFSASRLDRAPQVVFYPILTLAPWVLLFAESLVRRPRPQTALALALVTATITVGGGWQMTAIFLLAIGLVVLTGASPRRRLRDGALWLYTGAAAAVCLALAAPTLLPLAEFLRLDPMRSIPFRPELSGTNPISWDTLLLAFDPCALGTIGQATARLGLQTNEHNYSIGLALLPLYLLALRPGRSHRRWVRCWVAVALVGLFFGLGRHNPFYVWLQNSLPAFNNFRGPSRCMAPSALVAMVCAGVGTDRLLALRRLGRGYPRALQLVSAGIVGSTCLAWAVYGNRDWLPGIALLAASVLTCGLLALSRKAGARVILVGCLVQSAATWCFIQRDFFTSPDIYRQEVAFVRNLRDHLPDPNAKVLYATNPETPVAVGLTNVAGFSPLVPAAYLRYLFVALNGREMTPDELQFLMFENFHPMYLVSTPEKRRNPMYAMLCSAFIVTSQSWSPEPLRYPRFWFSHTHRVLADATRARAVMVSPSFDPEAAVLLAVDPGRGDPLWQPGHARIRRFEPSRVVFDLNGQSGWLTLSDSFCPGWVAEIDGREVPILRGNTVFRTIAVDPGARELTLAYRPTGQGWGWFALGALGALSLGLLALIPRRGAEHVLDHGL